MGRIKIRKSPRTPVAGAISRALQRVIQEVLRKVEDSAGDSWYRFGESGSLVDLTKAIRLETRVLKKAVHNKCSSVELAFIQNNLGRSLLDLYNHERNPEVLVSSLELLEQAARTLETEKDEGSLAYVLPRVLTNLGDALRMRADLHASAEDLNRAIGQYEKAVMNMSNGHPTALNTYCGNLAKALMARGSTRDIHRALDLMSDLQLQHSGGGLTKVTNPQWKIHGAILANTDSPVSDLSGRISKLDDYPSSGGGFADIYMGEWRKTSFLKQKVAIKVLRLHTISSQSPGFADRAKKLLQSEVGNWHGLDHPNIVQLLGLCDGFGSYPSLILPWFSNGSLSSYLTKHKHLVYFMRLKLIEGIANGMAYLHFQAVIHGDLSGANVLIADDGSACLTDFGLSILQREAGVQSVTNSSGLGGTIRWSAPELFKGSGSRVTPYSDVYSFGSVALQVFTGEMPYSYEQNDLIVLTQYLLSDPFITPERPRVCLEIQDIHWEVIQRCWSADTQSRPLSKELSVFFRGA